VNWIVANLGPLGVLLLMVPESACIPVPSEVTLMAAGFAVHQNLFGLPLAIAAATGGNLVGSLIAYAAGRGGVVGRLPDAVRESCDRIFARHGNRAVLIARLLPLARTFISLPAGRARVPLPSFVLMTVVGCAIWSAVFILAGDLSGNAWHAVSSGVGWMSLVLGGLILVGFVCYGRSAAHSGPGKG
jgi:membrane protein DedA with SNARE-associated domain